MGEEGKGDNSVIDGECWWERAHGRRLPVGEAENDRMKLLGVTNFWVYICSLSGLLCAHCGFTMLVFMLHVFKIVPPQRCMTSPCLEKLLPDTLNRGFVAFKRLYMSYTRETQALSSRNQSHTNSF